MKLIGIIGAMEVEVASLKEMMTDVTIRTKASMEFNHGYLNGKEVVVVRSVIGLPSRIDASRAFVLSTCVFTRSHSMI